MHQPVKIAGSFLTPDNVILNLQICRVQQFYKPQSRIRLEWNIFQSRNEDHITAPKNTHAPSINK